MLNVTLCRTVKLQFISLASDFWGLNKICFLSITRHTSFIRTSKFWASIVLSLFLTFVKIIILPWCRHYFSGQCLRYKLVAILYNLDLLQFEEFCCWTLLLIVYSTGLLSLRHWFRLCSLRVSNCRNSCDETPKWRDVVCFFNKNLQYICIWRRVSIVLNFLTFWANLSLIVLINCPYKYEKLNRVCHCTTLVSSV